MGVSFMKQNTEKRFLSIGIIVMGALFITLGIICLSIWIEIYSFLFNSPVYKYYTGDAYTGIQNAIVDTADNIEGLGFLIQDCTHAFLRIFGIVLLIIGAFLVYLGIIKLISSSGKNAQKKQLKPIEESDTDFCDI